MISDSNLQTLAASSLSFKDSDSQPLSPNSEEAKQDREKFSHQTLILTALTAINNTNNHSTFNANQVSKERFKYMKEKIARTPIIDAATTILVTDTEILATMARGTHAAHSIFALKEVRERDQFGDNKNHDNPFELDAIDEFLDKGGGSFEALLSCLLGISRYLIQAKIRGVEDVQYSRPPFHRLSCATARLDLPQCRSRANQKI
jgi:hypothetical protein